MFSYLRDNSDVCRGAEPRVDTFLECYSTCCNTLFVCVSGKGCASLWSNLGQWRSDDNFLGRPVRLPMYSLLLYRQVWWEWYSFYYQPYLGWYHHIPQRSKERGGGFQSHSWRKWYSRYYRSNRNFQSTHRTWRLKSKDIILVYIVIGKMSPDLPGFTRIYPDLMSTKNFYRRSTDNLSDFTGILWKKILNLLPSPFYP